MSNVSYDLDTSGGLMPLIRALIKPPDEDSNGQKSKKPQHPYYKRPGKGHNHDSCDACGEGGDLICCDRCPASFHLGCYDPPLDETDIPTGLWLCKECRGADENAGSGSARPSRAQSPVDKPEEKKTRILRNKKANDPKEESDDKESGKDKDNEKEKEEKELSPMEILVKAARILNPRQFELPREMRVPCLFPGTDKEGVPSAKPSVVSVDAWGAEPLPARSCFACGGGCRAAPLLQCDYCPLLFHQDCLDPPLTALPTGRWMCPNHVENYIDWKLVNSVSASERVALWERFAAPVDQHAVKIDFIRRARRHRPQFRLKVPSAMRGRVVVPGLVRYHYRHPPPLLPSRREYTRCRNALRRLQPAEYSLSDSDDAAPKHKICMNHDCPKYDGGVCPHDPVAEDGDDKEDKKKSKSASSSSLSDSDDPEQLTNSIKRRRVWPPRRRQPPLQLRADGDAEALLAAVDEQLEKLDERLVKLLAWQRLQQVLSGCVVGGGWRGWALSAAAEAAVARSVDRARLARHGFRHVALPSELLPADERDRIARAVWGPMSPASPLGAAGAGSGAAGPAVAGAMPEPSPALPDACVRATLCPVERPNRSGLGDGIGRAVPMRLSRLSVGADSGCDVRLDTARCRRLSPRHAVIFADEVTGHFELINYSEWGTRVNGVLYACDMAAAGAPVTPAPAGGAAAAPPEPAEGDEADARVLGLREIVARRDRHVTSLEGLVKFPSVGSSRCRCGGGPPEAAWEGSALVPHGALLHFGCLMYVFSITGAAPQEDKLDAVPPL